MSVCVSVTAILALQATRLQGVMPMVTVLHRHGFKKVIFLKVLHSKVMVVNMLMSTDLPQGFF